MKKIETELKDCYILEPDCYGDNRGWFMESYNKKTYSKNGLNFDFVQDNQSCSDVGIIRGLHFQKDPMCQAKIVRCTKGALNDVVVDMRKDSPSYGKWIKVLLTAENKRQLVVPRGFAHGFESLVEGTEIQYKADNYYSKAHDGGILYSDPNLNIDWDTTEPVLSSKDQVHPLLKDSDANFYCHKRYLITGCKGQLGYDLIRELNKRGIYDILNLDIEDLNITDKEAVDKVFNDYKPDCVFHCAAWTNVDGAEDNYEACYNVNVVGTKNISEASLKTNSKLIYISTDYVFDGTKKGTYDVYDKTNPQSVYGKTKYLGEQEAKKNPKSFIVRTSWVFGINGKNFVKTMLNLAETKKEINVVSDQYGSPTYTVDLAKLLVDMMDTDKYGVYHANNEGYCNWAEFADYIFKANNKDVKVNYILTKDYPTKAIRPLNSKLNKVCLDDDDFDRLPTWQDAVNRYSEELEKEKVRVRK